MNFRVRRSLGLEGLDTIIEILPFIIPLFILQLGLMIVALVDLIKRQKAKSHNKILWALLIVLVNIIGPVVYFIFGREE
ncbi:MAG: PLDc_N domain-containing protein [Dehalococcoidia bacterium]|nr:MAG: PLDc_N domain-containing protein [Dehalococcoidia bacterium]